MAKIKKIGSTTYWIDSSDDMVPEKRVHEHEKKRDKLITELIEKAQMMESLLSKLHDEVDERLDDYLSEVAEQYGEEWQGNATLDDFSGTARIERRIKKNLEFDERLQVARTKINQCVKNWSKGASQNLQALVEKAFKTDKKGGLDVKSILSLKSLKIDDPLWLEAIEIIDDSIKIAGTKTYYTFSVRNDKGDLEGINLSFSRA